MTCHVCKKPINDRTECSWTDGKRNYCSEQCARSPQATK